MMRHLIKFQEYIGHLCRYGTLQMSQIHTPFLKVAADCATDGPTGGEQSPWGQQQENVRGWLQIVILEYLVSRRRSLNQKKVGRRRCHGAGGMLLSLC